MEIQKFYNTNVAKALREAESYGQVASMPELLDIKTAASFDDMVWKHYFDTTSEEIVGTSKGKKYVLIVHGGGLLTADRIEKSLKEGLHEYSAKLTQGAFDNLLKGKISNRKVLVIPIQQLVSLNQNVMNKKYIIIIPFEDAQKTKDTYVKIDEMYENPLAIARAGGKPRLKAYLDKLKEKYTNCGSWHRFNHCDTKVPTARLLFLGYVDGGFGCGYLYCYGQFLGVRGVVKSAKEPKLTKAESIGLQAQVDHLTFIIGHQETRIKSLENKNKAIKEAL